MDKRSWPWKKKSSDKAAAEKAFAILEAAGASLPSVEPQASQESYKKPNYVQISVESYTRLTGLEDQVKTYEEQVETLENEINDLNDKLTIAEKEITTKENLVKQHAKVAEEAISGWEKAEAEALALKNNLESVTLSKFTAEDRASHLDGALKECMRQIHNLKEENEKELHDLALSRTKHIEKIKIDFESRISNLDHELRKSAADNAALSRSLHERSNMLVKLSEEKSLAEEEIERLRGNLESCEREINSLKYEHHVAAKELEIRTEEKNMSVRSADVANKQHLEGVKKIAKLEAECQRLRGLVRKKLPGPAAVAQMKLEVENLGRDYEDSRLRKSPVKPHIPSISPLPEFSIDGVQKFEKEHDFLTERLLGMEEETKMLKEALAKRNSELQASRNLCAKTASKLQSLEAELLNNNQHKSCLVSQNASNPPSLTSMSEDGNADTASCAGSWATGFISDLSRNKKERDKKANTTENANQIEIMDDFLEMEKLACVSDDLNISVSNSSLAKTAEIEKVNDSAKSGINGEHHHKHSDRDPPENQGHSNSDRSRDSKLDKEALLLEKLQSRAYQIFDSISKESDMGKIVQAIRCILNDAHDTMHQHCGNCVFEGLHCSVAISEKQSCNNNAAITEKDIFLQHDGKPTTESANMVNPELEAAISQVHKFVLLLGKEALMIQVPSPDSSGLCEEIDGFSATSNKILSGDTGLVDFVVDLSHVFSKANELGFSALGYKSMIPGSMSSDCIDKVALPEREVVQKDSVDDRGYPNGCSHSHVSDSASDPEVPTDRHLVPTLAPCKCLIEELEQLKSEKDNMAMDLTRSTETLESIKSQLHDTEHLLAELKLQLAASQKSNSLAETQLKCMAESYRSLEARAEELETEVNLLRGRTESLKNELQEERKNHQDVLTMCKDLQDQLQSSTADADCKIKEEKELASAAEKLAECQETISLLGRQLKAMRPQPEYMVSPLSERSKKSLVFSEEESTTSGMILHDLDNAEMHTAGSTNLHRTRSESPMDFNNPAYSPSDTEQKHNLSSPIGSTRPRHRSTKSSCSSSSSNPTPEKHSRVFSRFFSSKGRNDHH